MSDTALHIAEILLNSQAVTLSPDKPFRYTSGILSPIYCDNRVLISLPKERKQVINAFITAMESLPCDVVAGTATAGIPHAAWIADCLEKPMIYVRDKAKGHGRHNQIEGIAPHNKHTIMIEDLISTGQSVIKAAIACREAGAYVSHCCAIFSYHLPQTLQRFTENDLQLHSLCHLDALIEVALAKRIITAEQAQLIQTWQKDPENWTVPL